MTVKTELKNRFKYVLQWKLNIDIALNNPLTVLNLLITLFCLIHSHLL